MLCGLPARRYNSNEAGTAAGLLAPHWPVSPFSRLEARLAMIPNRLKRVNNLLQDTLSEILRREVKDPRVAEFATVTEVKTTADLRTARVFVSVLGTDEERNKAMAGLTRAAAFMRARLREKIQLRRIPELIFTPDTSIERGVRISTIIDKALEQDRAIEAQSATQAPETGKKE